MKIKIPLKRMPQPFIVRTAGGAGSQLVALMAAIQVSSKIQRPFQILHFPYSTGAYYPFAIESLLRESEVLSLVENTKFFDEPDEPIAGMVIKNHPVQKKGVSYENILKLLRYMKLDILLSLLRKEWKINYKLTRIDIVPSWIKYLGGGFPPFVNFETIESMRLRFKRSGIPLDFRPHASRTLINQVEVVIHYRIGDKRSTYANPTVSGDGIIDPICFKNIIDNSMFANSNLVYVVSDEPDVAIKLLETVGISAKKNPISRNLWGDMQLMLDAKLLICPWSTVSQFVMCIADNSQTKIYYPSKDGGGAMPNWTIAGVNFYEPIYLGRGHSIYTDSYTPEPSTIEIYKPKLQF
jgi:hypothetical protein